MTDSKIFLPVVDSVLKKSGFNRKGMIYYRFMNDDIIQGISIKRIFYEIEIEVCCCPYWLTGNYYGDIFKSKEWVHAEASSIIRTDFFSNDRVKAVEYSLQALTEKIIPRLDQVTNLSTHVEFYSNIKHDKTIVDNGSNFYTNIITHVPLSVNNMFFFEKLLYEYYNNSSWETIKLKYADEIERFYRMSLAWYNNYKIKNKLQQTIEEFIETESVPNALYNLKILLKMDQHNDLSYIIEYIDYWRKIKKIYEKPFKN